MNALLLASLLATFQVPESLPDKSAYTLFNPTPREQMRELSTDRPDTTESPRTVDAGHIQLEMSLVEFSREDDGGRIDSWAIAPLNFKVGVFNNVDVQFVFDPYLVEQTRGQPTLSGVGELTVRTKVNLIGNDEDGFALGIMPFVKFPTGGEEVSNDALEGGIIVPAAFELPREFSLGLMLELDAVRNDESDYDADLVHTAVLGRDLWEDFGAFVEYVGISTLKSGTDYQGIVNAGVTYGLTPEILLDGGMGFGLTEAAPDFRAFAGISVRY
jgi:hypothetical protein